MIRSFLQYSLAVCPLMIHNLRFCIIVLTSIFSFLSPRIFYLLTSYYLSIQHSSSPSTLSCYFAIPIQYPLCLYLSSECTHQRLPPLFHSSYNHISHSLTHSLCYSIHHCFTVFLYFLCLFLRSSLHLSTASPETEPLESVLTRRH